MNGMWGISEAVEARVGDRYSPEMRAGMCGAPLLIRCGAEIRYSDLNLLILPGLTALGISSSLHPLNSIADLTGIAMPSSTSNLLFTLDEKPCRAAVHNVELHADAAESSGESTENDPIVIDCSMVMRRRISGAGTQIWRRSKDAEWSELDLDFGPCAAALLTFKRASRQGLRSTNLTGALLRWIAFAAANTDRLIRSVDSEQTLMAAAFISECAGSQSNPAATRLRRCASAFDSGYISEGFEYLRQAVYIRMGITTALRAALERPVTVPLTFVDIRELIYLARAGISELKVLAVHRLASDPNCDRPDIRVTLDQIRYDSHVWVRKAAEVDTLKMSE